MNSLRMPSAVLAGEPATAPRRDAPVFVVDANDAFRSAIVRDFGGNDVRTDGFGSGESFLNALRNRRPGCVILDIHLPDCDSLELQEYLTSQFKCIPLIMVARDAPPATIVRAMRLGAHDFLIKPLDIDKLRELTLGVLQSARELNERELLREAMRRRVRTLTAREYHILTLALTGRSNKIISSMLFISPRTVETHRARILEKLGISNLLELAHAFTDTEDWLDAGEPAPAAKVHQRSPLIREVH